MDIDKLFPNLKFDSSGLIAVVVQDIHSRKLLTLAYMNRESLQKTLETKETWFWSRSRQTLWHKGATSGNTQRVERATVDCDGDALLIEVSPQGPACHTGAESCFFTEIPLESKQAHEPSISPLPPASADLGRILKNLSEVIAQRKRDLPDDSYTAKLFKKGLDHIAKKVAEESAETILAAKDHSKHQVIYETADLLYHLLVLLAEEGIALEEVARELAERVGKQKSEYTK